MSQKMLLLKLLSSTEDDEDKTTGELGAKDENQEGDFKDTSTQEGDSEPYNDKEF